MSERKIVVGVGGGIAAFKAVLVVRELQRQGCAVRVAMTPAATRFVGPITFTGLTGTPAVTDLWDPSYAGEIHVELGDWADAMVIVPATMNLMARAVAGLANDAVLATFACTSAPVWMAPAMHHRMWEQPATQRNVATLRDQGVHLVGPVVGELASGESGVGRMADPEAIARAVLASGDLAELRLLVTAGPTYEDLDPVRFLGNRSTGRMGFAIAEAARDRGATVTLVAGPTALAIPPGIDFVPVRSATDMDAAVQARASEVDAVVMAAAVADYRPEAPADQKIKKTEGPLQLTLVRNPDILAGLGKARQGSRPTLVGFALETSDVVANAQRKLARKGADLIVANHADDGFGGSDNLVTLVDATGAEPLARMSKRGVAERILDRIQALRGSG